MKKITAILCLILFVSNLSAKKVKFAVDMATHSISPNGIHLISNFQSTLGLGADWDPGTLQMLQQGSTTIYTVIVNLPAFKAYEFKFVNGNQTYEAEFVPEKSRVEDVGFGNDNRWIFLDSLANDTTFIGAIPFAGNAPVGLKLIRYKVTTSNVNPVSSQSIHVGTSYQTPNFNPATIRLHSFGNNLHEIINYVSAGTYTYNFFNGNTAITTETVQSPCANNGKRVVVLNTDSVLTTVCFSGCGSNCPAVIGINEISKNKLNIKLYPIPTNSFLNIETEIENEVEVTIYNQFGQLLENKKVENGKFISINTSNLLSGNYFVRVNNLKGNSATTAIIIAH